MAEQHRPEPAQPPALDALQQWQRVSPIALLYLALRLFKAIFGNIGYLAPALIVMYQGIQQQPRAFMLGVLALMLLLTGIAVLRYLAFRFRVNGDTIEIRSGVLHKAQLNLPFNRIQNVRLLQPVYYQPTGHLCVQLDTAGSKQQEAQLAALPQVLAHKLQQAIYAKRQLVLVTSPAAQAEDNAELNETGVADDAASSLNAEETLLCTRSVRDLVLYGISNNRIILVLALSAPFYNQLSKMVSAQLPRLGLDLSHWFNPAQQSWFSVGLAIFAVALLIMLVITLFSIALSVIGFYQFRLVRQHDRYIRRSGLFTRHEISMTHSRLQWIKLQQDWLDKLLGRCNLYYEQVQAPMAAAQEQAGHSKIMVPALSADAARDLLQEAYPQQQLADTAFAGVNWRHMLAALVFICLPLLLLSQLLLRQESPLLATLSLLPQALLVWVLIQRWRRFGYAMDTSFLYLRRGVVGNDYYCVPLHKLQQVSLRQHWFMRRARLQHLQLVFASGSLTIPYMPAADAQLIANYALYKAQASGKGWM